MRSSLRIIEVTFICVFLLMLLASCEEISEKQDDASAQADASPTEVVTAAKPWKVVGRQGVAVFVYVEPEKAHDRDLMAQILQAMVGQKSKIAKPVEILFFDKRSQTPVAFPMTDSQMLHQVAQYNYNPNNRFEEFVWLTVIDPKASPPKLSTKSDNISPGIAR